MRACVAQAPAATATVGAPSQPRKTTIQTWTRTTRSPTSTSSTLPTTLRLPKHKMAFRLTHRFARTSARATSASCWRTFLASIPARRSGLGLSYGVVRGGQLRHLSHVGPDDPVLRPVRSADQENAPLSVGIVDNVDGTNNFQDSYSPGIQPCSRASSASWRALSSAGVGEQHHPDPHELVDDNDTFLIGVGGRLRGGAIPISCRRARRGQWFQARRDAVSFGIEQRAGGHVSS